MKTSHLTFGQLHRLISTATLCRVTRVYHSALQNAWDQSTPGGQHFSVTAAEFRFPKIMGRYLPVLRFLTGSELRRIVRLAAEQQHAAYIPGGVQRVCTCDYWTDKGKKEAFELARLGKSFCEALNVPARVRHLGKAFVVLADTDPAGVAVLRWHPGVSVLTIARFLDSGDCPLRGPFWWLPRGTKPTARVNPLLRCVNTPDYQSHAQSIIFQ